MSSSISFNLASFPLKYNRALMSLSGDFLVSLEKEEGDGGLVGRLNLRFYRIGRYPLGLKMKD